MSISRRTLVQRFALGAAAMPLAACGTILHPERRGQTDGRIDPAIAVLDGLGLLLFLVPGLIAFGVDFYTGAIYLPGTRAEVDTEDKTTLSAISFKGRLTDEKMDEIWRQHYGEARPFRNAQVISRPMASLADFTNEIALAAANGYRVA